MSETRITADGDSISQALEDEREKYTQPDTSQSEKSHREIIESIKVMLKQHPEMSNKDIALEVGGLPKQVAAQRYLMSKGKEQQERADEPGTTAKAPGEKQPQLPKIKRVVRKVAYLGNVAEYVVENGTIEINIREEELYREELDEFITELQTLKAQLGRTDEE